MREILRRLMEIHHHNASKLSVLSGVPQSTIQRFLAGTIKVPQAHTLKRLAAVYGISEEQLRGETPLAPTELSEALPMELSEMEHWLIRAYRVAPPELKLTMMQIAHQVMAQYGYRSSPSAVTSTMHGALHAPLPADIVRK